MTRLWDIQASPPPRKIRRNVHGVGGKAHTPPPPPSQLSLSKSVCTPVGSGGEHPQPNSQGSNGRGHGGSNGKARYTATWLLGHLSPAASDLCGAGAGVSIDPCQSDGVKLVLGELNHLA